MGTMKDSNSKDLTEAEEVKKRWQEYTEELYKKSLNDPDNHNGVVTHLEPDILQCDVKGLYEVLLQTKLVEVMEFQLSSFKTYKMMLWKYCTQYASKFGKPSSGHRTRKCQVFIPIPKGNAKECSKFNCTLFIYQQGNAQNPSS